MSTLINKQINLIKILKISFLPLLIFSIIYCSAYAYTTYDSSSILYYNVFILLYLSLSYLNKMNYSMNIELKKSNKNRGLWTLLILIFGLVFSMLMNEGDVVNLSYYRTISIFTSAYLITKIIDFQIFVNIYIKVLTLLSSISLIIYTYVNLYNFPSWNIFTNSNGVSYYNGYINFVMIHAPERNTGIFWEPGIFSTFLIIGIVFETIFKHKTNWYIVMLFFITNITTLSTASYFLLIILTLIFINKNKNSLSIIVINIVSSLIIISMWLYQENIINMLSSNFPTIFGKLDSMNGSVTTRTMGPWVDINIFIDNFFVGVGFSEYQMLWKKIAAGYGVVSQTSTITYFMATIGMFGSIYVTSIFYGFLTTNSIRLMQRVFLLTLFLFILTKEPHQNNLLMNTILFYFIGGKVLLNGDSKR